MSPKNALEIFLLIFSSFVFSGDVLAQDTTKTSKLAAVKSLNKAKIYFVGFGLEREQKISNRSSIYIGAAIDGVVPFFPKQPPNSSDMLRIDYSINASPLLSAGYRNYYNLNRRAKLGKVIKNNSGSFVGLEYNLISPILFHNNYTTNYVSSFSPVWGFQRKVSNNNVNANLELVVGPSFQTDFHRRRASGFVRFGYSLLF